MRYQGYAVGMMAMLLPVGLQAMACGGNAEGGSTEPSTTNALSQAVETAAPRVMPVRVSATARNFFGARKGSGYADFELCSGGADCATAETTFISEFAPNPTGDAGPGACTVAVDGACEVVTCDLSAGGTSPDVSAGTLTISGGKLGSTAVKTNKADGFEYVYQASGAEFASGNSLSVAGSGGKVPAFTAQSAVAPKAITLTAPAANSKGAYKISTTAALDVTWTGGVKGDLVFLEGEYESSTTETYFSCAWKGNAGTGSVPADILAPMSGLAGSALVWGQQSAATDFSAGTYAADVTVTVLGAAPATFE